ncbi:MAG TPA: hypothetical protein VK837_10455 [Longimicrobiales bacterium]|nr:hypothetical protein [Longimicrobiales bacterium]
MRFDRLLQEIHRRSVWQAAAVFLGASWAVLEAIDLFIERGLVPEWTFTAGLTLLFIGLPVVIATALVQRPPGDAAFGSGPDSAGLTPGSASDPPPPHSGASHAPVDTSTERGLPPATAGASGAHRRHLRRLLTWRNALVGGVGAFALLGLAAGGYMAMRTLGIGPVGTLVARDILSEREPIIVADFGGGAGDSLLAHTVSDALRVDLSQSPTITVVTDEAMVDALRRMGRDPDEALDDAAAIELAVREGIAAVVVGDVRAVGSGFVLTARLLDASTGETLVPARETARDSTALIAAIDALSETLRERIGEPLSSLRRTPPLERVSTTSLDALRKYSQALRAENIDGDNERADALLTEAIALDSTFAMAHRKLGVILNNQGRDPTRSRMALIHAFRHRDRLPERERYMAEASYHTTVTGERARASNAYEALLEIEPDNRGALNNLAVEKIRSGDYARATDLLERGLAAVDSVGLNEWYNLVMVNGVVRGWDAAEATLDEARSHLATNQGVSRIGIELAGSRADYALAAERTHAHAERFGAAARGDFEYNLGLIEAARGRLNEAERHMRESSDLALREEGIPYWAMGDLINVAAVDLYLRGRVDRALARVDTVLRRFPPESMPPLDRPYLELAQMHADAGAIADAKAELAAYERAVPRELQAGNREEYEETAAAIAMAEGRYDDAIASLRRLAPESGPRFEYDLDLARVYDAAGLPDSARAAYTRYLEFRGLGRVYLDWRFRANALERLAQLHEEAGNLQDAARYYAAFAEQWQDADSDLQPRVEAARRRLQQILATTG